MKLEIYVPKPGCFSEEIYFNEEGSSKMIPIDQLDENRLKIFYHMCLNHPVTLKTIKYLQSIRVTGMKEVIIRICTKHFPKLNHTWDIDEDKLNIEC